MDRATLKYILDRISALEKLVGVTRSTAPVPEPDPAPGDALASAVLLVLEEGLRTAQHRRLKKALDLYQSTKNGVPTVQQLFGSPPDPVRVARYLLDSLTSGALGSLICRLIEQPDLDHDFDLKNMLRSLGEKL